jgi:hypothetical protein
MEQSTEKSGLHGPMQIPEVYWHSLPRVPRASRIYLCQRLTVLQESCKMAKFLKYNKLATSVVKIDLNTSITRRCQTFVRLNNR